MYERKNIEVKIEKTTSNTYICFIKFDMSNGDDFSRIESEEFKSIYDDSY